MLHSFSEEIRCCSQLLIVVLERASPSVMPDISTLPSSPGKPLFQNVTEESVDLEWTVPEKSGATAVKGYLLQYFSPEMGEVCI